MRPTIVIDAPEGDWGFAGSTDIDSDQSFFPITGFAPAEKKAEEEAKPNSSWHCLKKLMTLLGFS